MHEEEAISVGLSALAFIAANEEALQRLMAETGVDVGGLKARAAEPALLGAILDFLFADEGLLLTFCRNETLPPDRIVRARAALPGAIEDWA